MNLTVFPFSIRIFQNPFRIFSFENFADALSKKKIFLTEKFVTADLRIKVYHLKLYRVPVLNLKG